MQRSALVGLLRLTGLILFPCLLILPLINGVSNRQILLFLLSFSFQTNLIGWIYLIKPHPVLGEWAVRYLAFVAGVWRIHLSGRESNYSEAKFNEALHYVQPGIVMIFWLTQKRLSSTRWLAGYIYPLAYLLVMLTANYFLKYDIYPILRESPVQILLILITFEAILFCGKQE